MLGTCPLDIDPLIFLILCFFLERYKYKDGYITTVGKLLRFMVPTDNRKKNTVLSQFYICAVIYQFA